MARRWLVNTSNQRLVGVIDDDAAPVPAGREGVAQNVITATGVARADIKTNGLWVVTNGVGVYTAPPAATTAEVRDRRRVTLARNIIKNWLPAANGLLGIADAAVNLRFGVQIDAMVRCMTANASVDDHYDVLLAESLVNGYDFVLYAGDDWDNSTDGYYRAREGNSDFYPPGNWTFHTINQNLGGSPTQGGTGGTNHPNVTTNTTASNLFNWMRELWKLANP